MLSVCDYLQQLFHHSLGQIFQPIPQRLIHQTGDQSSQRMEVMLQKLLWKHETQYKIIKNAEIPISKQIYLHYSWINEQLPNQTPITIKHVSWDRVWSIYVEAKIPIPTCINYQKKRKEKKQHIKKDLRNHLHMIPDDTRWQHIW